MPLRDYTSFFHGEEFDKMAAAFDTAWQELAVSLGTTRSKSEINALRLKLAECIIISALDISAEEPEKLAQEALRCLHEDHLINHGGL
jgi:hypothetical protein